MENTIVDHYGPDLWPTRCLVALLLPHLKWRRHGIGVLQAYLREGDERELRVHVWSKALMLPGIDESGNAHNHRFTLHSTLLAGSLAHTEWNIDPVGSGFAIYDFVHARLHDDSNRAEMRRLSGEVGVSKRPFHLFPGDRYTFCRGAYHDTLPNSGVVVTLVEKVDQVEERARVIAPAHLPPVPAFSGPEPEPELVESVLRQAAEALQALL